MEISGKIIYVGPLMTGQSARNGNSWQSQDYVIETVEQYPRRCCFNIFGEDRIKQCGLTVGMLAKVFFDIDSHEYNGRWYNEVRAWKSERI